MFNFYFTEKGNWEKWEGTGDEYNQRCDILERKCLHETQCMENDYMPINTLKCFNFVMTLIFQEVLCFYSFLLRMVSARSLNFVAPRPSGVIILFLCVHGVCLCVCSVPCSFMTCLGSGDRAQHLLKQCLTSEPRLGFWKQPCVCPFHLVPSVVTSLFLGYSNLSISLNFIAYFMNSRLGESFVFTLLSGARFCFPQEKKQTHSTPAPLTKLLKTPGRLDGCW